MECVTRIRRTTRWMKMQGSYQLYFVCLRSLGKNIVGARRFKLYSHRLRTALRLSSQICHRHLAQESNRRWLSPFFFSLALRACKPCCSPDASQLDVLGKYHGNIRAGLSFSLLKIALHESRRHVDGHMYMYLPPINVKLVVSNIVDATKKKQTGSCIENRNPKSTHWGTIIKGLKCLTCRAG